MPGGIGRYAEELFALTQESSPAGWLTSPIPRSFVPSSHSAREGGEMNDILRASRLKRVQINSELWRRGLTVCSPSGVVHSPSLMAPLDASGRRRVSVTLHDLVPWTNPQTLTARGVAWHRDMLERAYRFADFIATPSHAVANQLKNLLKLDERVVVIPGASSLKPSALSLSEVETLSKLPEVFFLSVGTLEPRKGIDLALRAVKNLGKVPLIHVGPLGWKHRSAERLAERLNVPVHLFSSLGVVSDGLLIELYKRAVALVAPSKDEGFGLPLLEAMSFGTPVICSDLEVFKEVTAGHALFFEPNTIAGLRELEELLDLVSRDTSWRSPHQAAALARSEEFSWASSAQKLWAAITRTN